MNRVTAVSATVAARIAAVALALAGLVACGSEPLCGYVDEDADPLVERPICTYELGVADETIDYCPGDQWGSVDGCNSCGCSEDGRIVCTKVACD